MSNLEEVRAKISGLGDIIDELRQTDPDKVEVCMLIMANLVCARVDLAIAEEIRELRQALMNRWEVVEIPDPLADLATQAMEPRNA